MLLMYYLNENGDRVYTLKNFDPQGRPTLSAHPDQQVHQKSADLLQNSRFSPVDPYSKYRVIIKKRFGLLPTQKAKVAC